MHRINSIILIVSFLVFCWLGMQVVHEAGHVMGAIASGGRVAGVKLGPLEFSRTDLISNPHPLLVAWAGPVIGAVVPSVLIPFSRRARHYFRFFAGFCLVANGAYIGVGAIEGAGDAGDLLKHGAALWHLIAFGLLSFSAGLFLWHGLGPAFGIGVRGRLISKSEALGAFVMAAGLVVAEIIWGMTPWAVE